MNERSKSKIEIIKVTSNSKQSKKEQHSNPITLSAPDKEESLELKFNINNNNNYKNLDQRDNLKNITKFSIKLEDNTIIPLAVKNPSFLNYEKSNHISNLFEKIIDQKIAISNAYQNHQILNRAASKNKLKMNLVKDPNLSTEKNQNIFSLKEYNIQNLNSFMSKLPKINTTNELNYLFREYIINGKVEYLLHDLKRLDKTDTKVNIYSQLYESFYDICMKSKNVCEKLDFHFKKNSFIHQNVSKNYSISDLLDLDHEHNKLLGFSVMKLLEIIENSSSSTQNKIDDSNMQIGSNIASDHLTSQILNKNIEKVIDEMNIGKDIIPDDIERLISDDITEYNNSNMSVFPPKFDSSNTALLNLNQINSQIEKSSETNNTKISLDFSRSNETTSSKNISIESNKAHVDESELINLISSDPRFKHYLTNLIELILTISNKLNELNLIEINHLMQESSKLYCTLKTTDSLHNALNYENQHKQISYYTMLVSRKNRIKSALFSQCDENNNSSNNDLFQKIYGYVEKQILINFHTANLKKCVTSLSTFDYFTDLIENYYIIKREYEIFKNKIDNRDINDGLFEYLTEFKLFIHDLLHDLLLNVSSPSLMFDEYFSITLKPITIEQLYKFQYNQDSKFFPKDPRSNLKPKINEIYYNQINYLNHVNSQGISENNSIIEERFNEKVYVKNKYKNKFELKQILISNFESNNNLSNHIEKIDIIENLSDISIVGDQILKQNLNSEYENKKSNESLSISVTPNLSNNFKDLGLSKSHETPTKSNMNLSLSSVPPTPGANLFKVDENNNIILKNTQDELFNSTAILDQNISCDSLTDNPPCLENLLNIKSFFEEEKLPDNTNKNDKLLKDSENNSKSIEINNEKESIKDKQSESIQDENSNHLDLKNSFVKLLSEKEEKLPGIVSSFKFFSENLNKKKNDSSLLNNNILVAKTDDLISNIPNNRSPIIDLDSVYGHIGNNSNERKRNSSKMSTTFSSNTSTPSKIPKIDYQNTNENILDDIDTNHKKIYAKTNFIEYRNPSTSRESYSTRDSHKSNDSFRSDCENGKKSRSRKSSRSKSRSRERSRSVHLDITNNIQNESIGKNFDHDSTSNSQSNKDENNRQVQVYQYQLADKVQLAKNIN